HPRPWLRDRRESRDCHRPLAGGRRLTPRRSPDDAAPLREHAGRNREVQHRSLHERSDAEAVRALQRLGGRLLPQLADGDAHAGAKRRRNVTSRTVTLWDPPITAKVYETGDGDPVLFLHSGSGITPSDPLVAALAATGRRVIAPRHPGFVDPEELD